MTTPDLSGKVRFSDPAAALRGLLPEIDAHVHIVLSHLGAREDVALAERFPGLALVVGGHSHTPLTRRVGGTLVVQTHAKTLSLGVVRLDLDPDTWHVVRSEGSLLPVDPSAAEADERVRALADRHGRKINEKLKAVVGELLAPARRGGGLASSPAGNWMADVIRETGEADVGVMNKGGIRADLEAGRVTAGDVYRLMPFDNTVVSLSLTGADLRGLVEKNLAAGGYPGLEWSGMVVFVTEKGELAGIEVGGAPFEEGRAYRVATNSFLARGGDGFSAFARGGDLRNSGVLLRDALAADLAKRSPFAPPAEERLREVAAAR